MYTIILNSCVPYRYDMILEFWSEHADKRPSFSDLVMEISKLLEGIAGYMDFSSISANRSQDENSYERLAENSHGYDHLAESSENK